MQPRLLGKRMCANERKHLEGFAEARFVTDEAADALQSIKRTRLIETSAVSARLRLADDGAGLHLPEQRGGPRPLR